MYSTSFAAKIGFGKRIISHFHEPTCTILFKATRSHFPPSMPYFLSGEFRFITFSQQILTAFLFSFYTTTCEHTKLE